MGVVTSFGASLENQGSLKGSVPVHRILRSLVCNFPVIWGRMEERKTLPWRGGNQAECPLSLALVPDAARSGETCCVFRVRETENYMVWAVQRICSLRDE